MVTSCRPSFDFLLLRIWKKPLWELASEGLLGFSLGRRWCFSCSDFLNSDGKEATHATKIAGESQ